MTKLFAVCLFAAGTLIAAPQAAADPTDLVPYCSGDQTPIDDNCRQISHQTFTHDTAVGANPQVPTGVGPNEQPVI